MLLFHPIDHSRHLVKLFWANVGAVREAEVDQAVFALEIRFGEFGRRIGVAVGEMEWPAYKRSADAFVGFCDPFARHAGFFVAEVEGEACAGQEKEDAGLP